MKHILLAFLFILTSCSSVDRYVLSAKGDSAINPEKTETIYIGRLAGDNTGEFRAILSKALLNKGYKVGELPDRVDGINTFFNQIENPEINIQKSAILSGSVVINRLTETCTSNNQITCLSSVGIANINVRHAKDNTLILSESFRVALNNRQALVDTQNQAIFNIEYDTRRMLSFKVLSRLQGYSESRPYPIVTGSEDSKVNELGMLIAENKHEEAKSLFTHLFESRSKMSGKAHDELLLNGAVLHHLINENEEAMKLSKLTKTNEFESEYSFLNWR